MHEPFFWQKLGLLQIALTGIPPILGSGPSSASSFRQRAISKGAAIAWG